MKYGRRKWVLGTFALLARDAARRFAFGRRSGTRVDGAWNPLVLRWRRRLRIREVFQKHRARETPPIIRFPQYHFHYATTLGEQTQRHRSQKSSPAAGGLRTRVVMDHRWTSVRAAEPAQQPRHDSRSSSLSPAPHGYWRKTEVGSTPGERSRLFHIPAMMPSCARRSFSQQFGKAPELTRQKAKSEEQGSYSRRPSQISNHWLQILRVRQSTLDYRAPGRSPKTNTRRVSINDPEELVWPRTDQALAEGAKSERRHPNADSFHDSVMRASQEQEVAAVFPAIEMARTPQVIKLDPGLLDRLTEHVIQRVEQRARIERQRRGL